MTKLDDFVTVRKLAENSFSVVSLCVHRTTRTTCVLKRFLCSRSKESAREMHTLEVLTHKNIVTAMDTFIAKGLGTVVVLEFHPEGTLATRLSGREKRMSAVELVARVGRPISLALRYMAGIGFVHRDVRPENILLSSSVGSKLCGFGHCVDPTVESCEGSVTRTRFTAPLTVEECPEPSEDVWALGAVLLSALDPRSEDRVAAIAMVMASHQPSDRPSARDVSDAFTALLKARTSPRGTGGAPV